VIILVDTSVWIDHFNSSSKELSIFLEEGVVATHPFVIAELALGGLKNRREILSLMRALPETAAVDKTELLHFIDSKKLANSGVGFVDAHLMAAAGLMGGLLWTTDKKLRAVADKLDLAYV
jgi:predicted nucleic acid-binding protein